MSTLGVKTFAALHAPWFWYIIILIHYYFWISEFFHLWEVSDQLFEAFFIFEHERDSSAVQSMGYSPVPLNVTYAAWLLLAWKLLRRCTYLDFVILSFWNTPPYCHRYLNPSRNLQETIQKLLKGNFLCSLYCKFFGSPDPSSTEDTVMERTRERRINGTCTLNNFRKSDLPWTIE